MPLTVTGCAAYAAARYLADQLSGLQVQHAIHQFGERDLNRGTRFPQKGEIVLRDFIGPFSSDEAVLVNATRSLGILGPPKGDRASYPPFPAGS